MNKMDLIAAVADGTELSRIKAGEVVDAVFEAITDALKKKEEVRLVGFGTFAAAIRKASTGRNPRTGEEMEIPEFDHCPLQTRQGLEGLRECGLADTGFWGAAASPAVARWPGRVSRAVSSAVERLVYTERAGGSNPSPPTSRRPSGLRPQPAPVASSAVVGLPIGRLAPYFFCASTSPIRRTYRSVLRLTGEA